jgi:hypothetical protein
MLVVMIWSRKSTGLGKETFTETSFIAHAPVFLDHGLSRKKSSSEALLACDLRPLNAPVKGTWA